MSRNLVVIAAALFVAGCAESAGSAPSLTIADSAGVRIVENPATPIEAGGVWRLSAAPLVEIGGQDDPRYQLFQVTSAVRLSGGTIVVANRGTNELRLFDSEGRHVATRGGNGRGPGEFQQLLWVGPLPGDSIVAWDIGLRRWTIYDPGGDLVRTVDQRGIDGGLPLVHGVFGDGSLALASGRATEAMRGEGAHRDSITFLRVGRDGGVADTLGTFPGMEQYTAPSPSDPRVIRTRTVPFGKQTFAAAAGDGFYVATGDAYEYVIHSADGRLHTRVRKPHTPVRVTTAEVEAYKAALIPASGSASEVEDRRRLLDAAPYPATMPAVSGLVVDAAENVWIRETQRPRDWDGNTTWSIFDRDGRWIATAETPPRFSVLQVGDGWVLGVATAEDDVEHVRVYRLLRAVD